MQYTNGYDMSGSGGYLGEVRQADDGQFYQLSEVVDGLGNMGFAWLPLIKSLLPVAKTLLPQIANLIPNLGEVVYDQPQLGEVRQGDDGQLYQYTVDGFGNVGFAPLAALLPAAASALPAILPAVASALPAVATVVGNLFRGPAPAQAPVAMPAPAVIPAPAIAPSPAVPVDVNQLALRIAQNLTRRRRRRYGLGEDPYLSGLGEEAELFGLEDDLALYGYGEDPELYGYGEVEYPPYGMGEDELSLGDDEFGEGDDDLNGFGEDLPDELRGFGEGEDELGYSDFEPMNGVDGYLRQEPGGKLNGYVTGHPSASPRFVAKEPPNDMWKPLWA